MKTVFITLFSIVCSQCAMAIGGVWVFEINYEYKGKEQHGYVEVSIGGEYFTNQDEIDENRFEEDFRGYFSQVGVVRVSDTIMDQELIAEKASFPMHPFMQIPETEKEIKLADMKNIRFIKLWSKIAYMITVFTPLSVADTAWIGKKVEPSYPIGNEVGCRLEVHNIGKSKDYQPILKAFLKLYHKKDKLTEQEDYLYYQLLYALKTKKVVIVELCGC